MTEEIWQGLEKLEPKKMPPEIKTSFISIFKKSVLKNKIITQLFHAKKIFWKNICWGEQKNIGGADVLWKVT